MRAGTNGFRIRATAQKTSIGTYSIQTGTTRTCDPMARFTTGTTVFETIAQSGDLQMSVIQEAQAGDEIIIIQEFNASPEGQGFSWDTSRRFRVGERVRMARFFQDPHVRDIPGLGWTVVFETADGTRYAATQTHFVTEDCWHTMKRFFARCLMRDPNRRKASSS